MNQNNTAARELHELRAKYAELETEYKVCQIQLMSAQARADRQEERYHIMKDSYDLMVNSSGHRLLEKYYAMRRVLRPSLWKERVMARLEPALAKRRHKKNVRNHTLTRDDLYLLLSQSRRMDVLADENSHDKAAWIQKCLSDVGLECTVHLTQPQNYADIPYIILSHSHLTALPTLYMVYADCVPAAEQILTDAYAVFIPDIDTVGKLAAVEGISSRLYLMPMSDDLHGRYYLCRFLLAVDAIPFDRFYEAVGSYIHFDGNRVCLSLPESPERRASFDADNHYGFEVFPGLKHHLGWVGCGLSYKFIFRKAMEQQLDTILICEDDTYFPENFDERFAKLQSFMAVHDDWDVFSGVMADMGDAHILQCFSENGEEFVYLDTLISTVFNLYRSSMYPLLADWDNWNRNKAENAIDRYMENKNLRVLTTCPFLVGHKEDLDSTIWNHKNTLYNPGIESSSKRLYWLVDDYHYCEKQRKEHA